MAYIRTIKQNFFTSETIVALSALARLFFIALWLEADCEGRFVWKLKTLKYRYLPGDDCDIHELAAELVNAGLVIPYEVDGFTYAEIPTFKKHQVINNRERKSQLPPRVPDASKTRASHDQDTTTTPLVGKEKKEKDIARQKTRGEPDESFNTFWAAYPRKVAKQQAVVAWKKLNPSAETLAALMEGLEQAKASPSWNQQGGQFIPYAASWLNGRRWEDEPEVTLVKATSGVSDYAKGAV